MVNTQKDINNLITPIEMSERLGKSSKYIYNKICVYRQKYKKNPKWLVKGKKRGENFIDLRVYEQSAELSDRMFEYCSEKLYWLLRATNHSNKDIAELMSKKSKYFKSKHSWIVFFSKDLFVENQAKHQLDEPNRLSEFIRIGTKHLYLLKKWNKLDLSVSDKYYD